ncbi:MAG TPA: radical SAM protein, partial [Candidatus Omnitrophica bacterium]|nr:radical SAM protein [Candidatus Omnitrophota bacterium]
MKNFIVRENPVLIGISLMSVEYFKSCCLTKFLKSFLKGIPIIWGGIHPTISPEDCLNYADYVCLGEGEMAMLDIAGALSEGKDIKNINNLCY